MSVVTYRFTQVWQMLGHGPHVLLERFLCTTEFHEGLIVLGRVLSDGNVFGLVFAHEEYSALQDLVRNEGRTDGFHEHVTRVNFWRSDVLGWVLPHLRGMREPPFGVVGDAFLLLTSP
jgi:hypothetical protein